MFFLSTSWTRSISLAGLSLNNQIRTNENLRKSLWHRHKWLMCPKDKWNVSHFFSRAQQFCVVLLCSRYSFFNRQILPSDSKRLCLNVFGWVPVAKTVSQDFYIDRFVNLLNAYNIYRNFNDLHSRTLSVSRLESHVCIRMLALCESICFFLFLSVIAAVKGSNSDSF
jgi:hypothetical protein